MHGRRRSISRRLTQRNLHAAIRCINSGDPAMSPLLVNAIREHGDSKAPVFTSREVLQYRQLVSWVYLVAQKSAPMPTETVVPQPVPLLQAPLTPAAAPASMVPSASLQGTPAVGEPEPAKPALGGYGGLPPRATTATARARHVSHVLHRCIILFRGRLS